MIEIINKHGLQTVRRSIIDIFKQSEMMDKEYITSIPDGVYEAAGCLDNDGVTDEPVHVQVKVSVKGENLTIDLTGSSEQRRGMTNCGLAQTVSACRVAFKHLIGPDAPVTGGNFKTMDIVVPEKTIFSAQEPAACGWYFSALGLLIDLVIKALSPMLKEQSAAAHYGDSMVITFAGHDPRNDSEFLYVEPTAGGWGAFDANDGQSGLINNSNGDFRNLPVEVLEDKYPLKVNTYGLRPNSGGAGRNRGGLGIIREYEVRSEQANLYLWFERSKTPAWGLFNGESGYKPKVTVRTDQKVEEMLKVNAKPLKRGDRVQAETGGGGGFGHPFDINPEKVLDDVIDGYIDLTEAVNTYGVVLKGGATEVNYKETEIYRTNNRR
jgi:N-methylhydantoinase B